jgi:hypothetical protein
LVEYLILVFVLVVDGPHYEIIQRNNVAFGDVEMPYAKGVSAKTQKFDAKGEAAETDFRKIFGIIKASGWMGGFVGIEYEGGLMRDIGGDLPTCRMMMG